jgi:large subunit ribosomal protein L13
MRTFSLKKTEINRKWYVLDASEAPLGRVSTVAASLLIGKGKPSVTAHMDNGDFVIIINAQNTVVTGGKETKKTYYRHSGYPGGITKRTFQETMKGDPTAALRHSIRGMLPVNKLRDGRLARLKIYAGEDHNHAAQKPESISLKRNNNGK